MFDFYPSRLFLLHNHCSFFSTSFLLYPPITHPRRVWAPIIIPVQMWTIYWLSLPMAYLIRTRWETVIVEFSTGSQILPGACTVKCGSSIIINIFIIIHEHISDSLNIDIWPSTYLPIILLVLVVVNSWSCTYYHSRKRRTKRHNEMWLFRRFP